MKTINQLSEQLNLISSPLVGIAIHRKLDSKTLDCSGYRFGKYPERFTAILDGRGNVKCGSIRFYEAGWMN